MIQLRDGGNIYLRFNYCIQILIKSYLVKEIIRVYHRFITISHSIFLMELNFYICFYEFQTYLSVQRHYKCVKITQTLLYINQTKSVINFFYNKPIICS